MLVSLLLIVYNLTTAFISGLVFTRAISTFGRLPYSTLHPSILVISGWLFMSMQLQAYHLFRPIDVQAHLLVWCIAISFGAFQYKSFVKDLITSLHQVASGKHIVFAVLFLAIIALNICARDADGDIGDYHLQAIRWMEEYKVVPGLGNIRRQLGNNSNWFLLNAFSGMHFLGLRSVYTLNAGLILMCGLYVVPQLSQPFWLRNFFLLLYFAIVATRKYTGAVTNDVVITASIVMLFCWFTDMASSLQKNPFGLLLLAILSASLVTYKLSALPMVIFATGILWFLARNKMLTWNVALVLALAGTLLFIPWLATNVFHSGYLVFPVHGTDLFDVDWKMRSQIIDFEKYANLAYARAPMIDIEVARHFHFSQWFPLWIKSLDPFSLLLITGCALFLSIMIALLATRQKFRQVFSENNYWIIAITVISALVLWFIHGPTPRFVFGYLVFVNAMGMALLNLAFINKLLYKYKYKIAGAFTAGLLAVFVYQHFSMQSLKQAVFVPEPYMQPALSESKVDGGWLHVPLNGQQCWDALLPCTSLPDTALQFRGETLGDGFRIR